MSLKRILDVSISALGILVTAPLLIVIAIAVKLESKGSVCYRCTRVGQHGSLFEMLKFRTMVEVADRIDCKLCGNSDVRVTPLGKLLRKSKLNELPQLFNVLFGDMSLVGPRPEDPKFVTNYPEQWAIVLQVKPGIVGPNQVLHRNEEDLFPADQDPESFYVEHILPEKLKRDIEYVKEQSLWRDFALLLGGLHATVFKGRILSKSVERKEAYLELLGDVVLSISAYLIANFIRFETVLFDGNLCCSLALIAGINCCLFLATRLYARNARFFSLPDLFFLIKIVALAGIIFPVAYIMAQLDIGHSRVVFFLYPCVLLALLAGSRMALRIRFELRELKKDPGQAPFNTFIYGAGRAGVEAAKRLQLDPEINLVGFVDDNHSLKNRFVLGLRVAGTGRDLPYLRELYLVKCIVIAFQARSASELETAQRNCVFAGIPEIRVLSYDNGFGAHPRPHNQLRKVRFSDELGMGDVPLMSGVAELVEGAAAGIIGADHLGEHLCWELGRLGVKKIVLVDSCRGRLSLADRVQMSSRIVPEIVTWYSPWGLHAETQMIFEKHDVRWIFCNHLYRRVPCTSPSESELFLDFMETVRYVSMALRFPCDGFTLISPRRAEWLCEGEQSYHHLCEDYLAFAAHRPSSEVRLGTVQIPNLLEDDRGTINKMLKHISMDPLFPVSDEPMTFSSSRYAARTILNSLPMHRSGETYVQFPAHLLSLRKLMNFYRQKQQLGGSDSPRCDDGGQRVCDEAQTPEPRHLTDSVETSVKNLRIVTNPALPDVRRCERGIELYGQYLTPEDREALQAYISALRDGRSQQRTCRGQRAARLAYNA